MQCISYLYQWMEVGNFALRAPQHKDIFLRAHLLVDHLQAEDPYASYYLIGRKKASILNSCSISVFNSQGKTVYGRSTFFFTCFGT
jgi:hypothetical protein